MKLISKCLVIGLFVLGSISTINSAIAGNGNGNGNGKSSGGGNQELNFNEQTHLEFMCEEEKLARDVYITLGAIYPGSTVFGRIDDSEERHKCAVEDKLEKYGIPSPSTNDNVGVFTGKDYGWYFTEKFNALIERGKISELEALYVGAYIEEIDMLDINQCPKVIVEADNGINDETQCGKIYTDKKDIQRLYSSLLAGSKNHLRAYVKNIEKNTGAGSYSAQVLSQEDVNEILGR